MVKLGLSAYSLQLLQKLAHVHRLGLIVGRTEAQQAHRLVYCADPSWQCWLGNAAIGHKTIQVIVFRRKLRIRHRQDRDGPDLGQYRLADVGERGRLRDFVIIQHGGDDGGESLRCMFQHVFWVLMALRSSVHL